MIKFLRTLWLEACLRLRVVRAAGLSVFTGDVTPVGRLYATVIRADGRVENIGLVSTKVVTDAGVAFLVDALQGTATASDFKWHAAGTGNTAEAASQTALVAQEGSRVSGSQTEGASANIYKTVGTVSFTGAATIVEHGVFSASTSGTMLDRSVFGGIVVGSSDAIEFTYELTLPSGS